MKVKVVGVTFVNEEVGVNRQDVISTLSGNEKIYLKREPANRFDPNAVAVMLKRKEQDFKLGYVRAELASFLSSFWPKYKFFATICEIRTGDLKNKIPYGLSIEINHSIRKNMVHYKSPKDLGEDNPNIDDEYSEDEEDSVDVSFDGKKIFID